MDLATDHGHAATLSLFRGNGRRLFGDGTALLRFISVLGAEPRRRVGRWVVRGRTGTGGLTGLAVRGPSSTTRTRTRRQGLRRRVTAPTGALHHAGRAPVVEARHAESPGHGRPAGSVGERLVEYQVGVANTVSGMRPDDSAPETLSRGAALSP